MPDRADLFLIRHAPVAEPGRLTGRTDAPARIDPAAIARLAAILPTPAHVVASPADRCHATAAALFAQTPIETDPRLWEQDFGTFDGAPYADLPDLGPLAPADLAAHAWPEGESFAAMVDRVTPALGEWAGVASQHGPVVIVAHAGTVRAALARAIGAPGPALAFEVATLSLTRVTVFEGGMAVGCVNRTAP